MRREDDPRRKNLRSLCEPVWLPVKPVFPAGWFLASGFTREDLPPRNWSDLWDRWLSAARVGIVSLPRHALLLAELPGFVEEETDAHFQAFPSVGYAHDVLAQVLCGELARAALGESVACAPFPLLSPEEQDTLVRLGILSPRHSFPVLLRRYAILTPHPPAEGCSACALAVACPKRPFARGLSPLP